MVGEGAVVAPAAARGSSRGIVLIVLLAFGIPIAATVIPLWLALAGNKSYEFPRVRIDATVRPDGSLNLVERRTFDFDGEFSFAYFTVAWPFDRITGFRVAEGGRQLAVEREPYAAGFRGTWYFDAEDEEQTFTISYTARCAVDVYQDTAHLNWQFIGTGWEAPTESAVVRVGFPPRTAGARNKLRPVEECPAEPPVAELDTVPLTPGDVLAWGHGPLQGEVRIPSPDTVVLDVRDVEPFTFVEGSIVFPKDVVPFAYQLPFDERAGIVAEETRLAQEANATRRRLLAEQRRTDDARRVIWWLVIGIPVAMAVLVLISKLRDRVPGVPRLLPEPPEDVHPLEVAELVSGSRSFLAPAVAYRTELLHLVGEGALEMTATGRVTDPEDLSLRLRRRPEDGTDRGFVDALFGDDGKRELSLGEMDESQARGRRFNTWWRGLAKQGVSMKVATGRWEGKVAALLGLGGAVYGIVAASGPAGAFAVWLLPAGVLSLIAALIPMDRRVRPEFRERVARWKAFRRFLRRFSSLPDAPAMAVVIWERYLAYAVALGVAGQVEKQVKALVPEEELPSPWADAPAGSLGLAWFHHVSTRMSAPVSYSSSSSGSSGIGSFSSSGGGGGGFSGGGGGGGGGTGGGAG